MRTAILTVVAAGFAGMLALVAPAAADEEVIEHKKTESMHVETAPAAPVVRERERVIEHQQAPAAVVQKKSSNTVVKGSDNDDVDDDDDND